MSAQDNLSTEQFDTYYHGTDKDSADNIIKHGVRTRLYMHPDKGVAEDYGTHILKVEVPKGLNIADTQEEFDNDSYGHYHGHKDDNHAAGNDRIIYQPAASRLKISMSHVRPE